MHEGWEGLAPQPDGPEDAKAAYQADAELARSFAVCFRGSHGARVLQHLRGLTVDRILGPESSDALLRYVEGQRQLVAYIVTRIERGRHGPGVANISADTDGRENEVEQQ